MLRPYELVMVISPKVEEDGVAAVLDRVARFITERGGAVESQEPWGRRRLAYPINRFMEGNYILTHFQLDSAATAVLEGQLHINEDVIRHLLVRRD